MSKEDGGPAFPISLPGFGDNGASGMSLRDWFAGQALTALLTDDRGAPFKHPNTNQPAKSFEKNCHFEASVAYRYADAMLKAREA